MGSGKTGAAPPAPRYRDEPDGDDGASTSSAVRLDNIEYPEDELPPYTDEPEANNTPFVHAPAAVHQSHVQDPEEEYSPYNLPFSFPDTKKTELRTLLPTYSTDADALFQMISSQAQLPPQYIVELQGTHEETRRNGNKETKDRVTDFFIAIELTHLLHQRVPKDIVRLLPDNKRGYRGGRIISLKPSLSSDVEGAQGVEAELKAWCEQYVADKSGIKSFTLKREITNHDTNKLERLLRSAVQETNYRGHLTVNFGQRYHTVTVYSPGLINSWRTKTWVRWLFYLTMLWIIAWPILILLTARYEVVKAVFPYASEKPGHSRRVPTVQSEETWFHVWESAIRRAALARMKCTETVLDDAYLHQTLEADRRGREYERNQPQLPSTGSTFADGALGFLAQGARIAGDYHSVRGWGGDC